MSNRWIHERKQDPYHKKAKEEGYRSRSSYKLIQIHTKFKVFENANYILDLGAAPGGWLQVASEYVSDTGLIVGIDLKEIKPLWASNIITIVGDITDTETQEEVMDYFDGKADVILSDMAPDVMGQWDVDQYRQIHLARIALKLADKLLRKNGWFVVKVFQGGEHVKFIQEVKDMFEYVKNFKPKASRKGSSERYIVAKNLKKNRKLPREFKDLDDEEDDLGPLIGENLLIDEEYR